FEYMASGTPIVASRVPSLQEVLTENEAVFFTPDDAGALTDSINEVLSNEKESHERTENAKQKAAGYTWKKRAERICKSI
ncbi:MAG TPA: glycosyltransferase, partial [Ignavibacteria bacterium]|nr:glycosyltransferase [Ignavibacteria bacterium]